MCPMSMVKLAMIRELEVRGACIPSPQDNNFEIQIVLRFQLHCADVDVLVFSI